MALIISLTASAYELHVVAGLAIACIFDFVDYVRPDFFDAFFTILGGIINTRVYDRRLRPKNIDPAARRKPVVNMKFI